MSEDQLNDYLDIDLINKSENLSTVDDTSDEVSDNLIDDIFKVKDTSIINDTDNDIDINNIIDAYDSFYELMYA